MLLDLWIQGFGDGDEIIFLQCGFGPQRENGGRGVEVIINHEHHCRRTEMVRPEAKVTHMWGSYSDDSQSSNRRASSGPASSWMKCPARIRACG